MGGEKLIPDIIISYMNTYGMTYCQAVAFALNQGGILRNGNKYHLDNFTLSSDAIRIARRKYEKREDYIPLPKVTDAVIQDVLSLPSIQTIVENCLEEFDKRYVKPKEISSILNLPNDGKRIARILAVHPNYEKFSHNTFMRLD